MSSMRFLMRSGWLALGFFAAVASGLGQIYAPDGLRAPGDWNGWDNSHDNNTAFDLTQITDGLDRWVTTFQYTGTTGTVNFKLTSGTANTYANNWAGHSFTMDAVNSVGYFGSGGSNNTASLTQNAWYTLVFQDQGYTTTNVSLMETAAEPVSISSSSRTTAPSVNPAPGQDVGIDVTLSGAKSGDERVYLIYTANAWATRDYVEIIDFGGTATGSATIPGQAGGATVQYYVMTSTMDLNGVSADETSYDLRTIAVGGSGSYTVATTWEAAASPSSSSWEDAGYWAVGAVPPAGADVTVGANVTLGSNRTVGDLVLSGGTLTASDETPRTLTVQGDVTASGGALAAAGGTVAFTGGNVVSGTVAFGNVSVEGGGVNFGLASTVNGTLELKSGSYIVTNPPTYASGSTLHYNNGSSYTLGTEWSTSNPHHVLIGDGVSLQMGAATAKTCTGNLTVSTTGSLDMGTMAAPISVAGDVTINGTLSMSTVVGGDLAVGGDFQLTAGGTFNENDRALTFNGSGPQSVTGTETLALKYLIVDKSADTLKLETSLEVEAGGILWPTNGVIALNSNDLTLRSSAAGTAAIGAVGDTITGDLTFERYVPGNDNGAASFVNLSSYVEGTSVTDWSGANHVFHYNEAVVGGLNAGWVITSGTLPIGGGYMAQFPGSAPVTLSYSGGLTSGPIEVDITLTSSGTAENDGWNLIGNPYPAPVTFEDVLWTGTGGRPSGFWVYDGDNGAYTQKLGSDDVAVGQSFWVQANGSGTLTFEEADKATDSDPFVRGGVEPVAYALRVTDPDGKWSRGIRLEHPDATAGFDAAYDLRTFGDPLEAERVGVWFTAASGEALAIEAVANDLGADLDVLATAGGVHAFRLDPEYGTPDGRCLMLHDAYTGSVHALTDSTDVEIALEAGVHYADRFALVVHAEPSVSAAATWCGGGEVVVAAAPGWEVALASGEAWEGLAAGLYTVTWERAEGGCAASAEVVVPEVCLGDFTADASRGVPDLLALLPHLQGSDAVAAFDCDCDGSLGVSDLLEFLVVFGLPCNGE